MNPKLLLQIILLLLPILEELAQAAAGVTSYNCAAINFPFPFAVGSDCYIDNRLEIDCISDESLTKSITMEVFEFSLGRGKRYVGIKHCQNAIPSSSLNTFNTSIREISDEQRYLQLQECKYVLFDKKIWFETDLKNIPQGLGDKEMIYVPDTRDWKMYNFSFNRFATSAKFTGDEYAIFELYCLSSAEGESTYFRISSEDDDEYDYEVDLISIIILLVLGPVGFLVVRRRWLFNITKKRKNMKLKQKFFRKNGGLLLQQMLNSYDHRGNVERCKLFNSKEIDKATDQFNLKRVLGQGGQGTVYKGMLEDGTVVAVKKAEEVDKLEEFINEVVILSQISHNNVVKLLGCCLETEVPSLVYEFIPNGTLFQHLHNQNEELPFTWDISLRVATEVAEALSYLHTFSIYHRDIKSTNILLDEKYRAKIADFGISKSISVDQNHVTTKVQGTHGYLDPEYFQTSQYSDKSDVYSFGVVLVELLTRQKPIFLINSEEYESLAKYFAHAMEENRLDDILDARVRQQVGKKEEIMAFAKLAQRCLNMKGTERPTMREVAEKLEGIFQASKKKKTLLRKIRKKFST